MSIVLILVAKFLWHLRAPWWLWVLAVFRELINRGRVHRIVKLEKALEQKVAA